MTERFGAFGKIPSAGDFFRLSAPPGFVPVWDDWLQRAMLQVGAVLGEAWDAHYMSAPIWRFALSPGLAGPRRIIGVVMPSVDRVGRRFPLTLMAAVTAPGAATLDHFREQALFERLEDVALSALEDDMTRERLDTALAEIAAPGSRAGAALGRHGRTLTLSGADAEDGIVADLAAGLVGGQVKQPSLWSAIVAGSPRLMICDGLPAGPEMRALFDLDAPIWKEGCAA